MIRPRRPSRTSIGIYALFVIATAFAYAPDAYAQACCVGAGIVTPGRLKMNEDGLVGVVMNGRHVGGSFDTGGTFSGTPSGNSDNIIREDLFATIRLFQNGQFGLVVPIVQNRRVLGSESEWGGGIGDIRITGQYDLTLPGERAGLPGIALIASFLAPTGRAADQAGNRLGTDATGTGSYEIAAGVWVDQVWESWLLSASVWASQRTNRNGEQFGPRFGGILIGGYSWPNDLVTAFYLTAYQQLAGSSASGTTAPGSLRLTTAGIAAAYPLNVDWRLQANLASDIPITSFGVGETAGNTLSFSVMRAFM